MGGVFWRKIKQRRGPGSKGVYNFKQGTLGRPPWEDKTWAKGLEEGILCHRVGGWGECSQQRQSPGERTHLVVQVRQKQKDCRESSLRQHRKCWWGVGKVGECRGAAHLRSIRLFGNVWGSSSCYNGWQGWWGSAEGQGIHLTSYSAQDRCHGEVCSCPKHQCFFFFL